MNDKGIARIFSKVLVAGCLSLIPALSTYAAIPQGYAKFGKMTDKNLIVTNGWQAVEENVAPDSEWAKNFLSSDAFKKGITNSLHKKIAMFIIPVNDAPFQYPTYSTYTAYATGDYVIYNFKIYKCTASVTSGANTSWSAVSSKFSMQETPIIYKGFELKGSINNFASGGSGTTYYSQSELADYATEENDMMRLYVQSYHKNTDGRRMSRIANTITGWDSDNILVNVVVLIDTSCLVRTPETSNPEWLYEGNEDLFWNYVRTTEGGHEKEIAYINGGYKCLWRPVMPVRWFKDWPNWAE